MNGAAAMQRFPFAIRAAAAPPRARDTQRLLAVDPESEVIHSGTIRDLPQLLAPSDIVVVNDAATLPASIWAETAAGERFELRLAGRSDRELVAIALGDGDWRRTTEARGKPPDLEAGDVLAVLEPGAVDVAMVPRAKRPARALLHATVHSASRDENGYTRLVRLRFAETGSELYTALYRAGKPIQYSYLERPLALWDVQNAFVGRPWGFEMPSAARGLSWEILTELRRRRIAISAVTHAAGISSTGSAFFDSQLPLPEAYDIPAETVRDIQTARARGGRVIAVGTTVVRALESAAAAGSLRPGAGRADLVLGPETVPKIVGGVLSGLHEMASSHFHLLAAFAPAELLERALQVAGFLGYTQHEFGDAWLILPKRAAAIGR